MYVFILGTTIGKIMTSTKNVCVISAMSSQLACVIPGVIELSWRTVKPAFEIIYIFISPKAW